jgi:NAD(P)H-flavin reductase
MTVRHVPAGPRPQPLILACFFLCGYIHARDQEGKGSSIICDAEIGQVFSGMLPLGHFVLRDTLVSKCFIGTGTGFAPLYCQMLECRGL